MSIRLVASVALLFTLALASETTVFTAREGGYTCFRYPSLIVLKNGDYVVFAEARRRQCELRGPNDIVMKRSTDKGNSWQSLQTLFSESNSTQSVTLGLPMAVVDQYTGQVWLSFTRNYANIMMASADETASTWTVSQDISPSVVSPSWTSVFVGPATAIQTFDGKLMFFAFYTSPAETASFVFFSDSHGSTWSRGGQVPGGTQAQGAQLSDGSIVLNIHPVVTSDKFRLISLSADDGASFDTPFPQPQLVDAGSSGSMIYVPSLGGLVFSNPSNSASNVNMTVQVSYDAGKSWTPLLSLWDGPCYSSSLQNLDAGSNLVGVAFEKGAVFVYEKIVFDSFTINKASGF